MDITTMSLCRDLAIVLSQGQLPASHIGNASSGKNTAIATINSSQCRHMCTQLDCSRPLFGKSSKSWILLIARLIDIVASDW